ncbi:MAG TPA: hypothetical protein VGD38_08205 [Pyrinomonadaceae bacterium]
MRIKGISLRLLAAAIAFALGVGIATYYRFRHNAPFAARKPKAEPARTGCFPGKSFQLHTTGKMTYFPTDAVSESRTEWYSKHLAAMKEASLYASDNDAVESYRFLWLRSFHRPIAVRLWKTETDQFITFKETNGAGGYEPGDLVVDQTRKLERGEWDAFVQRLDDMCYWNLPTNDPEFGGLDGAEWILEGVRGDRYHMVDRWTPQTGSYFEACVYALTLAGFKSDPKAESIY